MKLTELHRYLFAATILLVLVVTLSGIIGKEDAKLQALKEAADYILSKNPDNSSLKDAIKSLDELGSSEAPDFIRLQKTILLSHPAFDQDLYLQGR